MKGIESKRGRKEMVTALSIRVINVTGFFAKAVEGSGTSQIIWVLLRYFV